MINFILKNPEIVEGIGETKDKKGNELKKGNIRIWTKYFDTLSGISSFKDNLGLVMNLGSGSLPAEHVVLFTAFINNGLDEIWSPEELLNADSKKAIDHLKSVIKDGSNRRQDIAAIVSKRLLNYSTHYKDKFTDKMVSAYGDIMESGYLSQDLLILSLKKICTFPKFNRLAMRPDLIKLLTL